MSFTPWDGDYGSGGGDISGLQNGSSSINVAEASVQSLVPSLPVKTDSSKKLVSGLITTSDLDFVPITTPYPGTLQATEVVTDAGASLNQLALDVAAIGGATSLSSEGGSESLVVDGVGPNLSIKGISSASGVALTSTSDAVVVGLDDQASPTFAGMTLTSGPLEMSGQKITGLAPGVLPDDAATVAQIADGSVNTRQGAYDNSTQVQIVTDATRGELVVKTGVADTDVALAVADLTDNKNFSVRGSGAVDCVGLTTVGAPIVMSGQKITGLAPGTDSNDAATVAQLPDTGDAVSKTETANQTMAGPLTSQISLEAKGLISSNVSADRETSSYIKSVANAGFGGSPTAFTFRNVRGQSFGLYAGDETSRDAVWGFTPRSDDDEFLGDMSVLCPLLVPFMGDSAQAAVNRGFFEREAVTKTTTEEQTMQGPLTVPDLTVSGSIAMPGGVSIGSLFVDAPTSLQSIRIGAGAGQFAQSLGCVAIGYLAAQDIQGANACCLGASAGAQRQGSSAAAFGYQAGSVGQGVLGCAVGPLAGRNGQGVAGVAVGSSAGRDQQQARAVAIGPDAGLNFQGSDSISIGFGAGKTQQGQQSVAIGAFAAGSVGQAPNSIVISATGAALDNTATGSCKIAPIRDSAASPSASHVLLYDDNSKELIRDSTGFLTACASLWFSGNVSNASSENYLAAGGRAQQASSGALNQWSIHTAPRAGLVSLAYSKSSAAEQVFTLLSSSPGDFVFQPIQDFVLPRRTGVINTNAQILAGTSLVLRHLPRGQEAPGNVGVTLYIRPLGDFNLTAVSSGDVSAPAEPDPVETLKARLDTATERLENLQAAFATLTGP